MALLVDKFFGSMVYRLFVEAVRVLVEAVRVIIEAVRKIIEAVRLFVEAVRVPVEAVRVLLEATAKIFQSYLTPHIATSKSSATSQCALKFLVANIT
jgi:hypothetical protein